MVKFWLLSDSLVSFQRPYNMIKLRLTQIKPRIFFDEKNASVSDLLDTLNQLALLVIDIVQLARLLENFTTQV